MWRAANTAPIAALPTSVSPPSRDTGWCTALSRINSNTCNNALSRPSEKRVFRPLLTTNRIAELCRQGREIPEEAFGDPAEICPLLEENACPVYPLRPFGCRCLVSRVPCRESGTAEMPDFVLTVNTVFLQTIEHLDATGCTGNLADVLLCLLSAENRQAYEEGRLSCNATGLIGNHPLTVLMVPPEHRNRLQPILGALAKLSTEPSSAL
jgi:hypothetical protein